MREPPDIWPSPGHYCVGHQTANGVVWKWQGVVQFRRADYHKHISNKYSQESKLCVCGLRTYGADKCGACLNEIDVTRSGRNNFESGI